MEGKLTRRSFLQGAFVSTAGIAAMGMLGGCTTARKEEPGSVDEDQTNPIEKAIPSKAGWQ